MRVLSLTALLYVCLPALPAAASDLEGRVVNAAGRPVAGATVYTTSTLPGATPEDPKPRVELLTAVTDASGAFRVKGVRDIAGEDQTCHDAVVVAPGLSLGGVHWHGEAGKGERVRIRLAPAAPWRAVVVDPQGKPIANCPVRLERLVLNFSGKPMPKGVDWEAMRLGGRAPFESVSVGEEFGWRFVKRSNARGEVVFSAAPKNGLLNLSIVHGDHAPGYFTDLRADAKQPAKLAMRPGAVLTGRVVVGTTGEPQAGVKVSATSHGEWSRPAAALTNARGEYVLRGLAPGKCTLIGLFPPGYDLTATPLKDVSVAPGKKTRAPDLKLVEGGVVTGTITDAVDGKPLAGARVGVTIAGRRQMVAADSEGRFRLRLPPWRGYVGYVGGVEGYEPHTTGAQEWVRVLEGSTTEVALKLTRGARSRGYGPRGPEVTLTPGTYPLKWVDEPGREIPPYYFGESRFVSWSATKPASVKGEPPLPKGAARRYATLRLDRSDRAFVVILQESQAGKDVDALYADTDGDGDLAEERRVAGKIESVSRGGKVSYRMVAFPKVTFQCPAGEGTRRVSIHFRGTGSGTGPVRDLNYSMTGCWMGAIETDKGPMTVVLGEPSEGGRPGGDRGSVLLDLALSDESRLGHASGAYQQLGEAQVISGKLYRFTPSPAGDGLKVEPYDGPVGTLRVTATGGKGQKATVEDVSVSCAGTSFDLEEGGEIRLPAGEYTIGSARVLCGEGENVSEITVSTSRPVTVEADKTTEVALGGALTMDLQGTHTAGPGSVTVVDVLAAMLGRGAPETQLVLQRGKKTDVKIVITDAQGGEVEPDSKAKERKAFRGVLRDAKGKEIVKATMEYG